MSTQTPPNVRVGVGLFLLHPASTPTNPKFLIGKRLNSHGSGTFALPGGHLEYSETLETCAARECKEETGLEVKDVRFLTATNDFMEEEGRHYVTMFMVGRRVDEGVEARVLEPEKCEGWSWVGWDEMVGWIEGGEGGREVFSPLVDLVVQRPGVVPRL